jgi:hypothetical protein
MIGGGGNLRAPGFQFPVEVRADISASLATTPADELRLDFGQPNVIRPSVGAHGCPVAALVIRAIDQETANASGPHFSEGDLGRVGGHRFTKPKAVRAGILAVNNSTTLEASRGVTVV